MKKLNEQDSADNSAQRIGSWVLYKNNQLIAFNKPGGIPVQSDKTGDKTLLQLAEIYAKSTVYLAHRIDRPASGVVLFAKTKTALAAINEQFRNRQVQKIYLAVVANLPPEPAGTLEHYVTKNGQINRSIASEEATEDAQLATLKYRHIASSERYHLLEIELITGRHHQIRAQLAAAGCPIKGDVKYGARRSNRDRSIHLHAWQLKFLHPVSNEKVTIVAPFPVDPVWQAFEDLNLEV